MTGEPRTHVRTIRQVLADPPKLHIRGVEQDLITHGLLPQALEFLEAAVEPGARTLEIGSGLSTIAFALAGSHHTAIVPFPEERERFGEYCAAHDIDASRVEFVIAFSEQVLPSMELGDLDLVLIDGSHSFPQVFMDWHYVQQSLKVGGILVVDDVHVWTGRVLRDFLVAEPEWTLIERWGGRTVAFRKTAHTPLGKDWSEQRYVWRKTRPATVGRARLGAALLRNGEIGQLVSLTRGMLVRRPR